MKLVLIGDVGGVGGYHAGDEAMLEVAVDRLRDRGAIDIVVISTDPADTEARHGVRAIPRIGFPGHDGSPMVRDQWLGTVLSMVGGPDAGRTTDRDFEDEGILSRSRAVIDAIAGADGVVVIGGGNLSSTWPDQLFERVAVLEIARRLEIPVVVTGQTLGPVLSARERELLATALGSARLIGVREAASMRLVGDLLPPTTPRRLELDDALFLAADPSNEVAAAPAGGDRDFVALTLNDVGGPGVDDLLAGWGRFVREVHQVSGLPVHFLPHVGVFGAEATGDCSVAVRLAAIIDDDTVFRVVPLLPAVALAALTRRAAAVVSTRYHPLVFALSGAVPCLAVTQDHYTSIKLTGALDHAGLGGWTIPLDAVTTDLAGALFDELWARRDEITKHLDALLPSWRRADNRHWDEVARALSPAGVDVPVTRSIGEAPSVVEPHVAGLDSAQVVADGLWRRAAVAEEAGRETVAEAERYARSLEQTLAARSTEAADLTQAQAAERLQRATVEAEIIQLHADTQHAEQSAAAARTLAAAARTQLEAMTVENAAIRAELDDATAEATWHRNHVDLLFATRTMRWSAAPRRAWQSARIRVTRRHRG